MKRNKKLMKNLISVENIEYSSIFILLTIFFWHFICVSLQREFWKTEMAKEIDSHIVIPSNFGEFIFLLFTVSRFIPFLVFIYRRKYETFILGFLIPSLIINIYTYYLMGVSLDAIYIDWSFWNLIPSLVLIYLLQKSKNLEEDLISIVFFVFLSEILCLSSAFYSGATYSAEIVLSIVFFIIFTTLYLILLSFITEKILNLKILTSRNKRGL